MNPVASKAHLSSLSEGYAAALAAFAPIAQNENVPPFEALGRVLADDLLCIRPLPPYSNSSMDGYGVREADAGKTLPIDRTVFAGDDAARYVLPEGKVCKVMTGGPIPAGVEAVVPFEDAKPKGDRVGLPKKIKSGRYIRPEGEEAQRGERLLKAGEVLTPAALAVIASQGLGEIAVKRRLKAAIVATGSEVVEPGQPAKAYQVHNSNAAAIYGILKSLGAEATYLGTLPDRPEAIRKAIEGFGHYDLVVTSGGVSVGEADFTDRLLREAGLKVAVQSMALKPGKNVLIGTLNQTAVISLPGNPQTAMVLMTFLGATLIAKAQGRSAFYPATVTARVKNEVLLKPDRAHVVLGHLQEGYFEAIDDYRYASGMLTPLSRANAFAVVAQGAKRLKKNELIRVALPLNFSGDENFYAR